MKRISTFELIDRLKQDNLPDTEIIGYLSTFYKRFCPPLLIRIKPLINTITDPAIQSVDIIQEIFGNLDVYIPRLSLNTKQSDEQHNTHVLNWLSKIFQNNIRSINRKTPQFYADADVEQIATMDPEFELAPKVKQKKQLSIDELKARKNHMLIQNIVMQLSNREQTILMAYMNEDCLVGSSEKRLSNTTMHKLSISLNLTPSNIRQIKSRILKKIKSHFDQHSK